MELNLTHQSIRINDTIFDGDLEQAVELDYSLPDYYPSIFKLLKCRLVPCVYACRTSGDKLVVDGVIHAKMLYICEENSQLHSVEQKIPFSKTTDMKGESQNAIISYTMRCDYVNCRVVNPRRINLHGAATIHITVSNQIDENVLADAQGAGIQLNRSDMQMGGDHLWSSKQFSVSEGISVGNQPPIEEIINIETVAIADECKIIANKVITKGQILVHILYTPQGEDSGLQLLDAAVPMSQIIDLSGVDEDYQCKVAFHVTSREISLGEDGKEIILDMDVTACCNAYINRDAQGITDAFSTQCELAITSKELKTETLLATLSDQLISNQSFPLTELHSVIDCICEIDDLHGKPDQDALAFDGTLHLLMIGMDNEESPATVEKDIPIDFRIAQAIHCDEPIITATAEPMQVEFSMNGENLNLKLSIKLTGQVICMRKNSYITDLVADESKPKPKNNDALTLYYPDLQESIWDIAKRFNTSVDAILEENGLEQDVLSEYGMILIPIVE